mgnify:CR=1 FL=1
MLKKGKVLVITDLCDVRLRNRYGLEQLKSSGFEVSIEREIKLKSYRNSHFIIEILPPGLKLFLVVMIAKLLNKRVFHYRLGSLPIKSSGNNVLKKISFNKVVDKIFSYLVFYDIVLLSNEAIILKAHEILPANSFCVDEIKRLKPNIKANQRVVYIDQFLDGHPEIHRFGHKIENSNYLFKVNEIITNSKYKNHPIMFAPHPERTNWENVPKDFILGEKSTLDLIAESEIIVGHFSTALQYAVYLGKKVVILPLNDLIHNRYSTASIQLSNGYGIPCANSSKDLDDIMFDSRHRYNGKLLTTTTGDTKNFDILYSKINEILS